MRWTIPLPDGLFGHHRQQGEMGVTTGWHIKLAQ